VERLDEVFALALDVQRDQPAAAVPADEPVPVPAFELPLPQPAVSLTGTERSAARGGVCWAPPRILFLGSAEATCVRAPLPGAPSGAPGRPNITYAPVRETWS